MRSELSNDKTVKDCLAVGITGTTDVSLPRLEVQMLLAHVLGQPRVWLIAHDDHVLAQAEFERFQTLCQRRLVGEPMAYLVRQREFMGLTFEVNASVLIPRPETELLVETALAVVSGVTAPRVLDLGTGSGAIALSMAHARPDAEVWATDISTAALELAQRNADRLGVDVQFLQGSWFDALDGLSPRFDVIVSNPPYIAAGDAHLSQGDLRFEPWGALTDESDGLMAYRLILARASQFLAVGGSLCLEHGFDQGTAVADLLRQAGFLDIKTIQDLSGHPRVTAGSYNG